MPLPFVCRVSSSTTLSFNLLISCPAHSLYLRMWNVWGNPGIKLLYQTLKFSSFDFLRPFHETKTGLLNFWFGKNFVWSRNNNYHVPSAPSHKMKGYFFFFCLFFLFRAAPVAYGCSQARGRIGAVATHLHHSHSSRGSELRLWPTPQLTTMPDP